MRLTVTLFFFFFFFFYGDKGGYMKHNMHVKFTRESTETYVFLNR